MKLILSAAASASVAGLALGLIEGGVFAVATQVPQDSPARLVLVPLWAAVAWGLASAIAAGGLAAAFALVWRRARAPRHAASVFGALLAVFVIVGFTLNRELLPSLLSATSIGANLLWLVICVAVGMFVYRRGANDAAPLSSSPQTHRAYALSLIHI